MPPAVRKVFLSSTARDLGSFREAVFQAISALDGFKCVRMEGFGARDWEADEFCRARVAECDVFVGLIGHLYGSSPADSETSFTAREYDAAVAAGIPRLMFLSSEKLATPPSLREQDELWRRQQAFRERLRSDRVVAFFDDPQALATQVVTALSHLERGTGGVRVKAQRRSVSRASDRSSSVRPPVAPAGLPPEAPGRLVFPGNPSAEPLRLFERSDSPEFAAAVIPLLRRARRITLIGTGLNLLHRDPLRLDLLERAARAECQVEIFLADPESPAVEARLVEEELGTVPPSVGRIGLIQRLDRLLKQWRDLGRPSSISIKLFTNYPTFALLIVDREYFVYPYAYATLGNFSPVVRFSGDDLADRGWIEFLDHHTRLLRASTVDAETAFTARSATALTPALARHLVSFAIYFIPSETSPLYRFGSEILGYDIRRRQRGDSPWPEMVGDAADFGFHLTLCDSLYFLGEEQVRYAVAEAEYLSSELKPFDLTNLRIAPGFPHASALALALADPGGQLEMLHHELVQRVYRRAAASNYTLGLAKLDRDADIQRAQLMLWRYRVPYILNRFRPHFTLLTRVPSEQRDRIAAALAERFQLAGCATTIRVERVAVMARPMLRGPWEIRQEIPLGRQGIAPS